MTPRIRYCQVAGAQWCGSLGRTSYGGLFACLTILLLIVSYVVLLEPALITLQTKQRGLEQVRNLRGEREALQARTRAMKASALLSVEPLAQGAQRKEFSEEALIRHITAKALQAGVLVEGIERSEQRRGQALHVLSVSARARFDALQLFVSQLEDVVGGVYLDEMRVNNPAWPHYSKEIEILLHFSGEGSPN